jgi:hypothetical protein
MKTKLLLAAISSFLIHPSSFAQGALTPPGAPAPTMKTLDQMEPRTPITNTTSVVTLAQPGSYYLTGNLTVSTGNGININTNGVTLDLNGFTIRSTAPSATGFGISLNNALSDITLLNGHIRGGVTNNGSGVYNGGGFANGIYYSTAAPLNVLVSRITVAGCLTYGIYLGLGDTTVVEACTARTIGSYGIVGALVRSCVATDCGTIGIFADQVSDSRGECPTSGYGIDASIAQNCYGFSATSFGIYTTTAQNCYGQSNSGYGLFANIAQNCQGAGGTGTGIYTTTAENCTGFSNGSGYGIYTSIAHNCYASSNSGYGIYANKTATGCYGISGSGTGLFAFIGTSCSGTTMTVTHNFNCF